MSSGTAVVFVNNPPYRNDTLLHAISAFASSPNWLIVLHAPECFISFTVYVPGCRFWIVVPCADPTNWWIWLFWWSSTSISKIPAGKLRQNAVLLIGELIHGSHNVELFCSAWQFINAESLRLLQPKTSLFMVNVAGPEAQPLSGR